ncbi:MAG: hypothetical protein ACR2NU_05025 [Aeoliella sp.]
MAIAFSCTRCTTRFKVPDRLAAKSCRCKKCGQALQIPAAPPTEAAVAASGVFRMGAVPAEQIVAEVEATPASSGKGDASLSPSLRLAPIASLDNVQPVSEKASPYWEEEDSVEYELEQPVDAIAKPKRFRPSTKPVATHKTAWSKGGPAELLLRGLRKISDFAYVPSMLCLMGLLLAIVLKEWELATLAALVVVALNIVRLCVDGLVLITLAFKGGPVAGVLFFIPPFTFYYLSKRGKVMKDALGRFLSPALPIAAVVFLFFFVPWLRGAESGSPVLDGLPTQESSDNANQPDEADVSNANDTGN